MADDNDDRSEKKEREDDYVEDEKEEVKTDDDGGEDDFFDHEPSKAERFEMRKASKLPSEWLRLLCREWAEENDALVKATDAKFIDYKPYLKGILSSQLLCRLSIHREVGLGSCTPSIDFWRILGVEDEFDKTYITSQIERFCFLYNIRNIPVEDDLFLNGGHSGIDAGTAMAALPPDLDSDSTVIDSASDDSASDRPKKRSRNSNYRTTKKSDEKTRNAQRKQKARERESKAVRMAQLRTAREASRAERNRRRLEQKELREMQFKEQKQAALRRAAELVSSNRVPIEITRGAVAAKAAAMAALVAQGASPQEEVQEPPSGKKQRSAIVVSTAADLHTICTHAKNLWAKYNAIAKEHNQKVHWVTVANELGIHVKVREKYCRMHARAEAHGFDWIKCGDWKIKDHPEIFLEPTAQEKQPKSTAQEKQPKATAQEKQPKAKTAKAEESNEKPSDTVNKAST